MSVAMTVETLDAEVGRLWALAPDPTAIAGQMGIAEGIVMRSARRLKLTAKAGAVLTWTPEIEAKVHELYHLGGHTSAEAAKAIGHGLTGKAITAGSIRRWGVRVAAGRVHHRATPDEIIAAPMVLRPDPVEPRQPRVLADVPRGGCTFPVGDDPGADNMARQLFCCEPVGERLDRGRVCRDVYCTAHRAYARPSNGAASRRATGVSSNEQA